MIAKTEKNLAANVAVSKPPLSIKSIIKDLQDLDKSLITKNELESMKRKISELELENSRIKNELEATEADRKLYYNQFHQNVKELSAVKAENQSLKAEISALKTTDDSFQSAIPINDSGSEIDCEGGNDDITPALAIENSDGVNEPTGASVTEQLVSPGSKRPFTNDDPGSDAKKAKIESIPTLDQWKCSYKPCIETRFTSIGLLRLHFVEFHPERKFMCERCPYSTKHRSDHKEHERTHFTNDLRLNGVDGATKCALCNVFFMYRSGLTSHNKMFH